MDTPAAPTEPNPLAPPPCQERRNDLVRGGREISVEGPDGQPVALFIRQLKAKDEKAYGEAYQADDTIARLAVVVTFAEPVDVAPPIAEFLGELSADALEEVEAAEEQVNFSSFQRRYEARSARRAARTASEMEQMRRAFPAVFSRMEQRMEKQMEAAMTSMPGAGTACVAASNNSSPADDANGENAGTS